MKIPKHLWVNNNTNGNGVRSERKNGAKVFPG